MGIQDISSSRVAGGHFKSTREGLHDGSAYKSAHLKASGPESNLWVPHGERRDLIPKSCPLTSRVPLHLHVHKLVPLKSLKEMTQMKRLAQLQGDFQGIDQIKMAPMHRAEFTEDDSGKQS